MTKLKQMRKSRRVSQCELAQGIGVAQGAVSRWETGKAKPSLENMIAIARYFNCKVDDLIDK